MNIEFIKSNGRWKCRGKGTCKQSSKNGRIPVGVYAVRLSMDSAGGWTSSAICIDCAKKEFIPQLQQVTREIEVLMSKDRNVALLNSRSDSDVVRDHCKDLMSKKKDT